MRKLDWSMKDDSTLVALGVAGIGYVITADHAAADELTSYTLHLPHGSYSSPILSRLMCDAEEIEAHHAERQEAA